MTRTGGHTLSARPRAALALTDELAIRDLQELSGHAGPELETLLTCLFLARGEGSLCLRLDEPALARFVARLHGREAAADWARRLRAACVPGAWPGLLSGDGRLPLVLEGDARGARLYFQKYWRHERALHALLRERLMGAPPPVQDPARLKAVLRAVLADNPRLERPGGPPLALHDAQKTALGLALLKPFTVISGGPGTGKTFLVFTLLRCLARLGLDPARARLAAPTGRAARRLNEQLREGLARLNVPGAPEDAALAGIEALTLHRLLGYNPARGAFRQHEFNRLPVDLLVVDEVSMVDAVLMARLLAAVPREARIVFLGDKDQLPPVEAGAVLARIVPGAARARVSPETGRLLRGLFEGLAPPEDPAAPEGPGGVALLSANFRSGGALHEAAQRINAGDTAVVDALRAFPVPLAGGWTWPAPDDTPDGCFWLDLPPGTEGRLRAVLEAWARFHHGAADSQGGPPRWSEALAGAPDAARAGILERFFERLRRGRILTVTRRGPRGAEGVNRFVSGILRPPGTAGWGEFFQGAPVMVTGNDYERGLFNGDTGVALEDRGGLARAAFPRPEGALLAGLATLPACEPAFATTVHRGQGSEFGEVLVILPDEDEHPLLTRELLYTAVTRARRRCVLAGSRAALERAIATAAERDAGLDPWT